MEKIAKLPNPRPQSVQCPCPISGNLHNAQCPGSCALCLVPCVLCTVSCVLCPVSSGLCPWSCVLLLLVPCVLCLLSLVLCPFVLCLVCLCNIKNGDQKSKSCFNGFGNSNRLRKAINTSGQYCRRKKIATKYHVYLTSICWSSPLSPISMLQGSTGPGNSKSMLIAACRDRTTKSFLQH